MKIFQFLIQNKKKEAEANIYVRMRVGRKIDIKQRTMFFVPVKNWDENLGAVKNAKTSELKELVVALSNVRFRLENAYLKAELNKERIDNLWLHNVLHREQQKEGALPETLLEYFDYYITVKKSTAALQSVKKWSSVRQKILAYEADRNYKVLLKDVNEKFRIDFEDY